jgi:hypothetical protein
MKSRREPLEAESRKRGRFGRLAAEFIARDQKAHLGTGAS